MLCRCAKAAQSNPLQRCHGNNLAAVKRVIGYLKCSKMFRKLDQASFLWQRLNLRSIELMRVDSGQPIQRN